MKRFSQLLQIDIGATLVDYALILMFVAIAALSGLILLGGGISNGMEEVSGSLALPAGEATKPALHSEDFSDKKNLSMQWEQIWGKWRVDKQGWFRSGKKWAKAVTFLESPDYEFSLDLQTLSKRGKHIWDVSRVVFRFQDPKNYYALVPKRDGTLELAKMQNGQWKPWLTAAYTGANPTEPHRFRVNVQGNDISVWQDGIPVFHYVDPDPIPSGGIGVTNDNSRGRFDNVEVKVFQPDGNGNGGQN